MSAFIARVTSCLKIDAPNVELRAPSDTNVMASSNMGPYKFALTTARLELGLVFPPDGGPGSFYITVYSQK
jgi:hypothetical protein